MLDGETTLSGAPRQCPDCGQHFVLQVMRSAAGYYVGTGCDCGPNSRESDYVKTHEAAERLRVSLSQGDPTGRRGTEVG